MNESVSFTRQNWPARAVVTAGMPYGNKPLHFGHIAGVFVPADCYARFLRDRIGADNVRFVSGTDCYGSPINEGYRKLVETGTFSGSIGDYVMANHEQQRRALGDFEVSLDIFEGSGIGLSGERHQELTSNFIRRLHDHGWLHLRTSLQFYDTQAQTFLNGRQVIGRCPVQGCKSEHGYADECDLGHSYAPEELIAPRSTLSDTTPEMRPVANWYFDLPAFRDFLRAHMHELRNNPTIRPLVPQTCEEFLGAAIMYIKTDERTVFDQVASSLPPHELHEAADGKSSFEVEFENIEDRDAARDALHACGLRFRTGKTLVPFRITGNIEWGVQAPVIDDVEGLTVWCWPESLWAPISFTIAANDQRGLPESSWRDFWCADDAEIYQFIGQDNLYFYGIAQPALWQAISPGDIFAGDSAHHPLRQTKLIANYHVLYGDKKASSSGALKPPSTEELLKHYTAEQLRAHFLALGLGQKSVSFKPKAFESEEVRNDTRVADPVLKESKLLHGVLNRLARSVLYEAKRNYNCAIPLLAPTPFVQSRALDALAAYDLAMKKTEFHTIMAQMDDFIRFANKIWAEGISAAETNDDAHIREQTLSDAAYLLWICTLLMHPIVPAGCEDICAKLNFAAEAFFSWQHDFLSLGELEAQSEWHQVCELEPRYDFF